jgi:hypothetical protein
MHTITEPSELTEYLFKLLNESKPKQEVNSSFLLRLSGICYSLINGGVDENPPYLSDILEVYWARDSYVRCGTKLVAFAQSLAKEGCFDPARVWSTRRLMEQMVTALDDDSLRMERDEATGACYIISTKQFSDERDVTVRVELEPEWDRTSSEQPEYSGHA